MEPESTPSGGGDNGFDEVAMEANALFSRESFENQPTKEDRMRSKAKKIPRNGSDQHNGETLSDGGSAEPTGPGLSSSLGKKTPLNSALFTSKNNRRKRNLKGRGLPKKGGAGGKGVWGKFGSELDESVCDTRDPNYDSDDQGEYKLEELDPVLSESQLHMAVRPIMEEYFEHGNTTEVEDLLLELNIGPNHYQVIKIAINMAMDRHNTHRELTSRLISDLHSSLFHQDDVAKCFNSLLSGIDDLMLDAPDAPNLLGQFIARCVADDCLAPKFISSYKGKVDSEHVKATLEKAEVLLSMNHGIAHLDNIWGCGGGNRPVILLTNKMIDLLKEYINSGDVKEAERCLLELEVPHFHHELVYQACTLAIEHVSERVIDMMVKLLKSLTVSLVITPDQFNKGIKRLYSDIDEICLDVPAGHVLLEQIINKLHSQGVLSSDLALAMPARGRKRFVSEGDAGFRAKGASVFRQ